MLKRLCLFSARCFLPMTLAAQTQPSAEGPQVLLWVGASFSSFNPDYGCSSSAPFSCWGGRVMGISPYAATPFFLFNRIGAEGQARFLIWHGPSSLTETSYMAGPSFRIGRFGAFSFSASLLLGSSRFHIPAPATGSGSYFAYAPDGAVDYRLARRVSVRGDYEYQRWPSFAGVKGKNGLTPNGLSVGISYAVR